MTRSELAAFIDHTVLKPETGRETVERICDEAAELGCFAVCIPPRHVPLAVKRLAGTPVRVATVAGFPNGDTLSSVKAAETRDCIAAGAHEVDMVIPIGAARDGDWKTLSDDILAVVQAGAGNALIKVIIEATYLTDEQKVLACKCAQDAGADFVKTSTGFASAGATVADVRLMRQTVGPTMGVKAAGGIRDLATALAMIEAGATRLGCSASVAILEALDGNAEAAEAPAPGSGMY